MNPVAKPPVVKDGRCMASCYGIWIKIRGEDGIEHFYAHLESISSDLVKAWRSGNKIRIKQGDEIGIVGATGFTKGQIHLHFEIGTSTLGVESIKPIKYKHDKQMDPEELFYRDNNIELKDYLEGK